MALDTITRRYQPQDREPLLALWTQVLPASQPWNDPVAELARKLSQHDDLVFVAEKEGILIGAVVAGYDGIRGWIYRLAVSPENRRLGIGRQLLKQAESALLALGCPKVNLQVRATNSGSLEFYRRCGYLVQDHSSLGKPLLSEADSPDDIVASNQVTHQDRNAIDSNPRKTEVAFLDDQLEEFNKSQTGRDDFVPIHLVRRNDDGAVIAGLKGSTGWDWLYVEILWIHEKHRRTGIGSQLLQVAESQAQERGCIGACLTSYSFQAPEFYERHGYSTFGQINDYPVGSAMFFLSKRF